MSGAVRSLALLIGCASLSGCVAVIAPIVAAGAIGGKSVLGRNGERRPAPVPVSVRAKEAAATPTVGSAPTSAATAVSVAPAASVAPAPVPLPTHDWRAMVSYVAGLVQAKTRPVNGAVLAPSAASGSPATFLPCEAKPFAVIVDADGTVLPPPDAPDGTSVPTADAARAVDDLRFGHVATIFITARPLARASATENALNRARLGPAMQGRELLFGAGVKSPLRIAVAQQYCVLALVGDELADFSDGDAGNIAPWGAGWFRVSAGPAR